MIRKLSNTAIAILPKGELATELELSARETEISLVIYNSVADAMHALNRRVLVVLLHADFSDAATPLLEEAQNLRIAVRVLGAIAQGDVILSLLRKGARGFIPLPTSAQDMLETLRMSFDLEAERHIESTRIGKAKLELEAVFDAYPTPLFVIAPDGLVRRANAGAMVLSGKNSVPELLGRHFCEVLGITDEKMRSSICEYIERREDITTDILIKAAEGNPARMLRIECFTSSPAQGFATALADGLLLSVRDVTKLIEQEQQEVQTQQLGAVALLAATLSHEINQPLGTILGRAQLALMSLDSEAFDKKSLERDLGEIVISVKRIGKILKKVHRVTDIVEMTYLGETKMLDLEKSIEGEDDV